MLSEEDVGALIKLASVKGIGQAKLKALISNFKPISTAFSAPRERLYPLVGKEVAANIKTARNKDIEPELSLLSKLGVNVITYEDPAYPENLRLLPDCPPFLYVKGEFLPQDEQAIAIVGSRRATYYGKQIAHKFASEFAYSGVTIISGLARGIDASAHTGALEAGGRTIAVLGSGIDIIYPPENRSLIEEISKNGAYISEFPPGTKPWGGNFPTRNRLISGLSKAVVVMEASMKSGALLTVKWALDQGKEVFAVPGNITSETSKGVNYLIIEGAHPVAKAQDVLEELGIKAVKGKKELKLPEQEAKLFNLLTYENPISCDKLAESLGLGVPKILQILLNLELQGIVKQLPGKNFIKTL